MKDLSLHILDIVQNSIRAGAREVNVLLSAGNDGMLSLQVTDDGMGMNQEQLSQVKDPFFTTRTTRKIGLGVSLLTQKAVQAGGSLTILSEPGEGTELKAIFQTTHPDCPPLGDIPGCAWMLMASNPDLRLVFRFMVATDTWDWDSVSIQEALGGIPITEEKIRTSIIDWFQSDFIKFKEYNGRF